MATERTKPSIPIYTVDAFSTEPFRGNPAAVCLLPRELVSMKFDTFHVKKTTTNNNNMMWMTSEIKIVDTLKI